VHQTIDLDEWLVPGSLFSSAKAEWAAFRQSIPLPPCRSSSCNRHCLLSPLAAEHVGGQKKGSRTRRDQLPGRTDEDIARLIALAKQGATALKASAPLNRARGSVVKKTRELGLELPGVREAKAKAREMMEQTGSGST